MLWMDSEMDELMISILEKSKYIALKYIKNLDIAEEIAQLSAIQLYLNYNKIDKTKINNWIFTVTRNLCIDFHRKKTKDKEIFINPITLSDMIPYEQSETMTELDLDVYDFISQSDRKLLKKYYNENVPLQKLAQNFKIKRNKLTRKIHSLENEIKLYHLINSDVIFFNPLPSTKLTKNINNFIKSLVKALNISNFSSMKRYCKGAIIHETIKKIKINSYETCKIQIINEKNYQITIGYLDPESKIKVFDIRFNITDSGNIQVLEMPIIPEKVLVIDKKYIDPKYAEKELLDRKGLYNNKLGSFDELEKNELARVIQTESDFNE